jgi:hypothetical protein
LRLSRPAVILSALLLTQAAVFYGFSRSEQTPIYRPLDDFPVTIGSWHMFEQGIMEPEINGSSAGGRLYHARRTSKSKYAGSKPICS